MVKKKQVASMSLREKKHAKTKISLKEEFLSNWTRKKSIEKVSIKDVCKKAEVSEGTFYNYFPDKVAIINYALSIDLLEMIIYLEKENRDRIGTIEYINLFFEEMYKSIMQRKYFYEMIAIILKEDLGYKDVGSVELSLAEKMYLFPKEEDYGSINIMMIDEYLENQLKMVFKSGLISNRVSIKDLTMLFLSILVGVPLAMKKKGKKNIGHYFKKHLGILWDHVRK